MVDLRILGGGQRRAPCITCVSCLMLLHSYFKKISLSLNFFLSTKSELLSLVLLFLRKYFVLYTFSNKWACLPFKYFVECKKTLRKSLALVGVVDTAHTVHWVIKFWLFIQEIVRRLWTKLQVFLVYYA